MKQGPWLEPWQILDVGSIWMKEFASALAREASVEAWEPEFRWTGALARWTREEVLPDPPLAIHRFPLQRGYARAPLRSLLPFEGGVLRRLLSRCKRPQDSPLVCSTPFYAPVAERWPGPVVYYVTDLTRGYEGLDPARVLALDRRMCRAASAVCPNSARIAHYLREEAGCAPPKLTVVPNATRAANVAPAPLLEPGPLPDAIAHLPRPIAGVIGNLAANMDWHLLAEAIARTPWLTWVLVGPTGMPIADPEQARARAHVLRGPAHSTGAKPYGELQRYARCFDVAVLPYKKKEPTYSGSSTRFYEHLAACRPMVATRGFAELMEKPPLLLLVDEPAEMEASLTQLRACSFRDGLETARWEASLGGTWEQRARAVMAAVASSFPASLVPSAC